MISASVTTCHLRLRRRSASLKRLAVACARSRESSALAAVRARPLIAVAGPAMSPHQHTTSLASARGSLCCSMGAHSLSALEIFAQISNLAPISAVGGVTSHSNGIICGQKRVKHEKDTLGVFRQHTGAPWGNSWRVFTPFYRLHPISPTFANKFRSRGGRIQHDPARVHATRAGFAPQHDTARPSTTSDNLRSLQFRTDALR